MKKKLFLITFLVFLILGYSLPALAEGSSPDSPWEIQSYLRLWGLDMAGLYKGFNFFEGLDTKLWVSLGGGVEAIGFYREGIDNTIPYTPPVGGTDIGAFTRTNYLGTLGLGQGLVYDQNNHRNLVELDVYYRKSIESYSESNGVHAKIFDSGLPDKNGITQDSVFVGVQYHGITVNQSNQVRKGIHAETSLELAPKSINEIADFTRWNTTVIGFLPLVETEGYCIYTGERLMYDRLYGNYIPINARSSFGGNSVFPGIITMGTGGALRGVGTGRFDGYDKLINNLEMRFTFPGLLKANWILPGIIVYYDMGYTDNLSHSLDMARIYSSTGTALFAHVNLSIVELDLGVSYDYFINEQRDSLNLLAYLQF